jgi:hypothetical protein
MQLARWWLASHIFEAGNHHGTQRELVICNESIYSGFEEHRIIAYTATGQTA